jgi:hypothetical protein
MFRATYKVGRTIVWQKDNVKRMLTVGDEFYAVFADGSSSRTFCKVGYGRLEVMDVPE